MLGTYCKASEVETTITCNGDYDKRPSDVPVYNVECPNCGAEDELVRFDVLGSRFDCPAYSKHNLLKYKVDKIHYICENCGCEFFKTYRHDNATDEFGSGFSWLKTEISGGLWQIVRLICYILIGAVLVFIAYANDFSGGIAIASALFLAPIIFAFCFEFVILFMK